MKSLKTWIGEHIYPLLLALIGGILAGANYTPQTFLTGWDTLHPEFNFSLAFSRMMSGVWRADQGLGAVAIQSHIADLPRVVILWLAALVVPTNLLRYGSVLLALSVGPVGVFYLTKFLLHKKNESLQHIASFIAALVYLGNLATVQLFVVPLEMFTIHYALVPWLFLYALRICLSHTRRDYLIFVCITLLATAQAHTATLFYAYFTILIVFLSSFVLMHKNEQKSLIKYSLAIVGLTLTINAFWLLPNIYAIVAHGNEVRDSKVNRLFTPEAFAKNQLFGNISDTALLKNFLFDWQILNPETKQFEPILQAWIAHLQNPGVAVIGYTIFGLAVLGIVIALAKKERRILSFVPVFLFSIGFILNGTWPITIMFDHLGGISPILKEALRFPFAKFSILLVLAMSVFVGYGIEVLLTWTKKLSGVTVVIVATAFLLPGYYFFPAFTGNLVHPAMRIQIPKEYFDLFDWFDRQEHSDRVAMLPIHSFWNWTYYDWGYQGAGFLQFGIPQSILDRDYDRWSPVNGQYQKEMSYAVYSQNPKLVRSVLMKYDIRWVLVDLSVTAPGMLENAVLTWRIPDILLQTGKITEAKRFGQHIVVYEVQRDTSKEPKTSILPLDVLTKDERYVGNEIGELVFEASSETPDRFGQARTCGYTNTLGAGSRTFTESSVRYESIDTPLCDYVSLPQLDHDRGYVVEIESNNESGFPLQLCISNNLTSHCDLFEHLHGGNQYISERFLILPLRDYGSGYTLNFNNFTIRGRTSVNNIRSIKIYIYPNQKVVSTSSEEITQKGKFILSQAFDPGWTAWERIGTFPYLRPLQNHVLVNNWENGWELQGNEGTIVVFFLPQLLQWIGFGLLPLPFLFAIRKKSSET